MTYWTGEGPKESDYEKVMEQDDPRVLWGFLKVIVGGIAAVWLIYALVCATIEAL